MIKYGKLIRDIVPDDQIGKTYPKFYPSGTKIKITPLGFYVEDINNIFHLMGWIYKNTKTQEIYKLEEGIDYILN